MGFITPPAVSIPRSIGVISNRSRSWIATLPSFCNMAALTAAGLRLWFSGFLFKRSAALEPLECA